MALIVLMKDKTIEKQFSPEENLKIGGMLKKKVTDMGLLGMFINPIQICPPLIITKDEIDEIVTGFDRVIGEIEKEFSI